MTHETIKSLRKNENNLMCQHSNCYNTEKGKMLQWV